MEFHLSGRPLIDPALKRAEVIDKFLAFNPFSKEAMKACFKTISSADYDRPSLSKSLFEYNEKILNDELALGNCKLLKQPDATVVVSGQQAGIFSGPALTIYKIITTINLARHYTQDLGTPVIPIFWNATEDHDLAEINTLNYPGKRWKVDFPKTGVAVEYLKTTPSVRALVSEYISTIPPYHHREEIEHLLSGKFENYGEFSSNLIAKLFRGTGLVIVEPRILRTLGPDFFHKTLKYTQEINENLKLTASELTNHAIKPSFEISSDTTGLFYINTNGIRNRILARNDKFLVDKEWISQREINELINRFPKRFSTSAFLRPIFQSSILPNIGYVAGPGEFQYHLQLKPLYTLFNVVMPIIYPRNHATVLTRKELKLAQLLKFDHDDYFKGPTPFYNSVKLRDKHNREFLQAKNRLEKLSLELHNTTSALISQRRIDAFQANVFYQLEKLKKKAEKEYARGCKIDNARIDRFFDCLLPKNRPQERIINVLYFIEADGIEFINHLIKVMDPFEAKHYVLYTKN